MRIDIAAFKRQYRDNFAFQESSIAFRISDSVFHRIRREAYFIEIFIGGKLRFGLKQFDDVKVSCYQIRLNIGGKISGRALVSASMTFLPFSSLYTARASERVRMLDSVPFS